jgi:hypothetical protein
MIGEWRRIEWVETMIEIAVAVKNVECGDPKRRSVLFV